MIGHFKKTVRIGPYKIGDGYPPLIVAEIGGNHGGRTDLAKRMIDAAAACGVKAVKFQIYKTDCFLVRESTYYEELAREELKPDQIKELADYTSNKGLIFLASVFDEPSVQLLSSFEPPAIKIASGDLNNLPLLKNVADLGKPVILSTGGCRIDEIDEALEFLSINGVEEIVPLHCTTLYPCPDDQINLRVLSTLRERYQVPVGFSDHSLGMVIPLSAIALGACMIEKHFTCDNRLPGGDNEISILPEEMKSLVQGAKRLAPALGDGRKEPTPGEQPLREAIRRSVVASRPIKAGDRLGPENMACKRPGNGLPPKEWFNLTGRETLVDLNENEVITWDKVR